MLSKRPVSAASIGAAFALIAPVVGCSSAPRSWAFRSVDDNAADGGPFADGSDGPVPNIGADYDASVVTTGGGVLNDANPDARIGCKPDAGGAGPVQRVCVHYGSDQNECDGHHDLVGFAENGKGGNGFDDNCNGLVDEGCECASAGTTKPCYLVPAAQTSLGLPVGWCAQNSKGTVDCVRLDKEFSPRWSGQCRGAQPPFVDDICANGDFDCDGRDQNSKTRDCSCKSGPITCPTAPVTTAPYPPPSALPLRIDAANWFPNSADVTQATNFKWTLRGGDCDNILPHPSFAIYPTRDGTGAPVGAQSDTLGMTGKEHGIVASAPAVGAALYPAFSLSGDYVVLGEFDLGGEHFACSQKIQVRAPGIRAEGCWDTEEAGIDLDLHMAKVDGFSSCEQVGWATTCANQDCYYANCSSQRSLNWYPPAASSAACGGWGAQHASGDACRNPRLDRDANGLSGRCDPAESNPNASGGGRFCGPENINVDAPSDGSRYAVAMNYFSGNVPSRAHVNLYCNGERVFSAGYNPTNNNDFPVLANSGGDDAGDMWKVGMIVTHVANGVLSCEVAPSVSQHPYSSTDGPAAYCVDTTSAESDSKRLLTRGGFMPLDADALCFH